MHDGKMSHMLDAVSPAQAISALGHVLGSQRVVLGIAGPPGAGKSSLAERVVARVPGSVLVPMDGFHLAHRVLDHRGLANRKGAPETFDRAGFAALLRRIREQTPAETQTETDGGDTVYAPAFRRDIEEPIAGAIPVPPETRLVVIEGNYLLLWPEVHALLDQTWWVDLDDDVRRQRLVERHASFGKTPEQARAWALGSDEANARLVAPGRDLADVVVRGD
jgi:pantothenate kinase